MGALYTQSPIQWSRIAFFLGLIGLLLGGGIVYSLTYFAYRVEASPPQLVRRIKASSTVPDEPEPTAEASPDPNANLNLDASPEPSPTPSLPQSNSALAKRAALDTLRLMRPILAFVVAAGIFWIGGTMRRRSI